MAINQNHTAEELNGIKCAVVEKNVSSERVAFLRKILEFNKYEVVVAASAKPAPKPAASATLPSNDAQPQSQETGNLIPTSPTFTVGVTDLKFNTINAIFGRLLKNPEGHVITLGFWEQRDQESRDEIPYFEKD